MAAWRRSFLQPCARCPPAARSLAGVDPEALKIASRITGAGGRVPLSSWAKELPFASVLADIAKQFGYDPVQKAAETTWLPKTARSLLSAVGVPRSEQEVVGRTSAVPLGEAGAAAKAKAAQMLDQARTALENRVNGVRVSREQALKEGLRTGQRDIATQQTSLVTEADRLRSDATKVINHDLASFERLTDEAVKRAGENPGDLSRKFGEQIVKLRGQLPRTPLEATRRPTRWPVTPRRTSNRSGSGRRP